METSKYIRVYKQHSEKAGYFFTNTVRKVVKVLGFASVYQKGTTGAEGRHTWWVNDEDVDGTSLPQQAWGCIEGDVITDEQYRQLTSNPQPVAPVETTEASAEAPF